MTAMSKRTIVLAAAAAALIALETTPVSAQCATCVTPTVAYSPVVVPTAVAAPVVVRTGWYPGRFFDRLRMNRWLGAAATPTYTAAYAPATPYVASYAPTYTAAYAPTVTAGYAPVVTAAYAPAATYTASYAPYVTAYAPLQTAVVQPVVSAPACASCPPATVTSYAPSTVYRPVEVAPVVVADPCAACATCAPAVSQTVYTEGAVAAPACINCAAAPAGQPVYEYGGSSAQGGANVGPQTPQPALKPEVATPGESQYPPAPPPAEGTKPEEESVVDPKPEADDNDAATPPDNSTSLDFPEAPPLVPPQNDRTANRPTVDVHNAVYRQPVRQSPVSTTAAKPVVQASSAPKMDANGWYSAR